MDGSDKSPQSRPHRSPATTGPSMHLRQEQVFGIQHTQPYTTDGDRAFRELLKLLLGDKETDRIASRDVLMPVREEDWLSGNLLKGGILVLLLLAVLLIVAIQKSVSQKPRANSRNHLEKSNVRVESSASAHKKSHIHKTTSIDLSGRTLICEDPLQNSHNVHIV